MAQALTDHPARGERRFRMGYDEYRRTVDESAHAEWVEGEVTIFMPPSYRHQEIAAFLGTVLRFFLAARGLGTVLPAPFEMRLRFGRSYREPDLLIVLDEHRRRLTSQRLEGAADLVVEILSPESVPRDREEKRREYAEAGIPEYWIIDAQSVPGSVEVLALIDGRYEPVSPDDRGRFPSLVLPGFAVDPEWFAVDDLPSEPDVLRALLPDAFAG